MDLVPRGLPTLGIRTAGCFSHMASADKANGPHQPRPWYSLFSMTRPRQPSGGVHVYQQQSGFTTWRRGHPWIPMRRCLNRYWVTVKPGLGYNLDGLKHSEEAGGRNKHRFSLMLCVINFFLFLV
ncbi:hypothetical protein D1007_15797 [Hordeum vulgare]|nr:hypothetical protein D1007_15797 [Hordeum vulgare]